VKRFSPFFICARPPR